MKNELLNIRKSPIVPIAIHIFIWLSFLSLPLILLQWHNPKGFEHFPLKMFIWNNIILIAFFYLNYLVLIPKLFLKRKIWKYISSIFLSIVVESYIVLQTPYILNIPPPLHDKPDFNFELRIIIFTIIAWAISTGIKMTNEWFKNESQKTLLEKEKLGAELAYLKSQMNPHFFFNVLNNICSLARKKSDDTEPAIIKLSQLMRYNLYTSQEDKVELEKEIQYLHDYIDIQKMRLANNVSIDFKVDGNIYPIKIEPLLFITFVENAFKHGINPQIKSEIKISINVIDSKVIFKISNYSDANHVKQNENEGIGLKNVTRRLNILYPSKHILSISKNNNKFIVDLTIETHD